MLEQKETFRIAIPSCLEDRVNESLRQVGKLHRKRVLRRAGTALGSFVAMVAAFLTFGFTNPALASQIPVLGRIFQTVNAPGKVGGSANLGTYGLAEEIGLKRESTEPRTEITVKQAYGDSNTVQLSLVLKLPEEQSGRYQWVEARQMGGTCEARINGETVREGGKLNGFQPAEEGLWVATMILPVPEGQREAEHYEISLFLRDLVGRLSGHGEETSAGYEKEGIPGEFRGTFTLTPDRTHFTSFDSHAEMNGAKLLSVTTTPARTEIQIEKPFWGLRHPTVPEDGDLGFPYLFTEDGEEILMEHGETYDKGYRSNAQAAQTATLIFDSVPAGTKKLVLWFCDENQGDQVTQTQAKFVIDLEQRTVTSEEP